MIRRLGILDMLQLAAGLSMAGPMFIVGFELVRTGQPLGVIFFGFGAFALYFPTYLVKRIGGPRAWIRRRFERRGPDDGGSKTDDENGHDSRPTLLTRLRRWRSK